MKGYLKGLVTGLLIGAAVTAVPAVADNIDALFNEVRININGIDRVQWDESIKLADGTEAPYSILYNGTTYLPLRKTAELLGKEVYWNGDSRTVSVVDNASKTTFIAEKSDKNGNMWKYSTVETDDGDYYLLVEDEQRDFTRAYRMMGSTVGVKEDLICFVRESSPDDTHPYYHADVIRIAFENDSNTQDGETIYQLAELENGDVVFDGDYLFCIEPRDRHYLLKAYNYVTDEVIYRDLSGVYSTSAGTRSFGLQLRSSDEGSATFKFIMSDINTNDDEYYYEITFDKTTNTFGESKEAVWEDE